MRGGWAIWLVAGTGSLAAHLGLVTALSGMTLEPPAAPLADLYIADAASEAPLAVEAVAEDEALPLDADTSEVRQIAATPADPQPVEETPVTNSAEAVTPAETQSASADEIAPRASQLRAAQEATARSSLDTSAELPEAQNVPESAEGRTSPVAENEDRAPELVPDEVAASPPPAEPRQAEAEPAYSSAAKVEPEISAATAIAGTSPVAETDTSAPAIDPAADTDFIPANEIASEAGEVEPRLSAPTEAVAPEAAGTAAGTKSTLAAPETATAQTVAEAGSPVQSVESASSAAAAVAGSEVSAAVGAASPAREPEEPVASAASQPQDTTQRVEQQQQVAALSPTSELPLTRRERMGRFKLAMQDYDPGKCFFLEVAGPDRERPKLNGLAATPEAIADTRSLFQSTVGVQPEMAVQKLMEAQCPAIDFIRRQKNRSPPILVRLAADVIRGGDLLVGRLTRATFPYTLLFIVDDDGIVHNLTDDLLPDVDGQTFAAEIRHTAEGKSRNQLIVAVGSTVPLEIPGPRRVGEAAPFLERLQAETAAAGAKLSLGYATFRVE